MFSKNITLLCVCNLIKMISSNEIVTHITSVEGDNMGFTFHKTILNFPFKFNPVDEVWRKNKCESLGFTFIKHKDFKSALLQNYHYEKLYEVLSELICGDKKFGIPLQKSICSSIKSNEDLKKLFRDEEAFIDYLDRNTFKNPVSPYNKDGSDVCPICLDKADLPVVFDKCLHSLCKKCAAPLEHTNQKRCPVCRENFSSYTDEGKIDSTCSFIEYYAAAYYLDVCIFLFMRDREWMFFDKNGPNYSEKDMENKKCIYLFRHESKRTIGVVVETRELSYFGDFLIF
ncbi:uncharacterized protein LOC126895029 [Daktulosphaira vitifoliae]|uniref:uncharacterized protein LOC126895029 n=1 Tax=Daktulosphaira vitifoliae TaxID=58002 RepID=UPI0021AA6E71|nr:uncharacterized protein LOC126895029 [Daktulosphaira vitifoliae]